MQRYMIWKLISKLERENCGWKSKKLKVKFQNKKVGLAIDAKLYDMKTNFKVRKSKYSGWKSKKLKVKFQNSVYFLLK